MHKNALPKKSAQIYQKTRVKPKTKTETSTQEVDRLGGSKKAKQYQNPS
jgi:hypothetical protein